MSAPSPGTAAHSRVAVVTGASSGIGEATARTLAALGFHVVAVARRADRIRQLAEEIGGSAIVADITDEAAVDALAAGLHQVDVLVNNAGGAKGLTPVAEANLDDWRWMWGDQRAGHAAGHPRAAAQAGRLRGRIDRHHHLDRRA